jgi:hypothetical protein
MACAKKATEAPTDPLDATLARLQLCGIRDQLVSLLDEAARANLSARETLILLCEREIARKDHRRIEMALKLAHFPAVKELAGFDFEAHRRSIGKQIRNLAVSTLDRQRREPAAAGSAGRRQDALVDRARASGDSGRIHGAIHDGDDAGCWPRQGHGKRGLDEKLLARSPSQSCSSSTSSAICRWSPMRRTCSSSWSAGVTKPAPC